VFIVAPFSSYKVDFPMHQFPDTKEDLKRLMDTPDQLIKSLSYYTSHTLFRYEDWFAAKDIYSMGYGGGYEPYYIGPKSYPWFDEIFIGCGADKVSHPEELNNAGYRFFVHPTGFIVHLDSTGMGSAWCRGWTGHRRSNLKWNAFSRRVAHQYSSEEARLNWDSTKRKAWWDLSPNVFVKNEKKIARRRSLFASS